LQATVQPHEFEWNEKDNTVRVQYTVDEGGVTDISSTLYGRVSAGGNAKESPGTIQTFVGEVLYIDAVVANHGAADAAGVQGKLFVPADFTPASTSSPDGGGDITYSWRNSEEGEPEGRVLVFQSQEPLAGSRTTGGKAILEIRVTGSFSAPGAKETQLKSSTAAAESNLSNNTAILGFNVLPSERTYAVTKKYQWRNTSGDWEDAAYAPLGSSGRFVVELENHGTETSVSNVVVTDIVPAGFAVAAPTPVPSGFSSNLSGQVVQFTGGNSTMSGRDWSSTPPGDRGYSQRIFYIPVTANSAGVYTNTASVTWPAGGSQIKTDRAASVVRIGDCRDAISVSGPADVSAGQEATYQFSITSDSPLGGFVGQVNVSLPPGWSYLGYYDYESQTVVPTTSGQSVVLNISPRSSSDLNFTGWLRVRAGAGAGPSRLDFTTVSSGGCGPASFSITSNVSGPDLSVSLSDFGEFSGCGEEVVFSGTVRNDGAVGATNIVTRITLDGDADIVSVSTSAGGTWDNSSNTVTFASIGAGSAGTVTYRLRTRTPQNGAVGSWTAEVEVAGGTVELDLSDNAQSASQVVSCGDEEVSVDGTMFYVPVSEFGYEIGGQRYMNYQVTEYESGRRSNSYRRQENVYSHRYRSTPFYAFTGCSGNDSEVYPTYGNSASLSLTTDEGSWNYSKITSYQLEIDPSTGNYEEERGVEESGTFNYSSSAPSDYWANETGSGTRGLNTYSIRKTTDNQSGAGSLGSAWSGRNDSSEFYEQKSTKTQGSMYSTASWWCGDYQYSSRRKNDASSETPTTSYFTGENRARDGTGRDISVRWKQQQYIWNSSRDWSRTMVQDYSEESRPASGNGVFRSGYGFTDGSFWVTGWDSRSLLTRRGGSGEYSEGAATVAGEPVTDSHWAIVVSSTQVAGGGYSSGRQTAPFGIDYGPSPWGGGRTGGEGTVSARVHRGARVNSSGIMFFIFQHENGEGTTVVPVPFSFSTSGLSEGWANVTISIKCPDGRNINVYSEGGALLGTLPPGSVLLGARIGSGA
jgi:uncharacterized repeat protein (TIGR01451 family)